MSSINADTGKRETYLIDFGMIKKLKAADLYQVRPLEKNITNIGTESWVSDWMLDCLY